MSGEQTIDIRVIELYAEGHSMSEVARRIRSLTEIKISETYVNMILEKNGISKRGRYERRTRREKSPVAITYRK